MKVMSREKLLEIPASFEWNDNVFFVTGRLVSEQPAAPTESLVSEQPRPLRGLNDIQWRVVHLCDVPRSMQELLNEAGISSRQFFRSTYLEPLILGGIIRMTYPDIPNHPRQTYVLTDAGVRLKSQQINGA